MRKGDVGFGGRNVCLFFKTKKTPTEVGVFVFLKTINALRIEVPYVLCGDRISYVLLHGGHV